MTELIAMPATPLDVPMPQDARVIDLDRNLVFAKDSAGRFVLANEATARAFARMVSWRSAAGSTAR